MAYDRSGVQTGCRCLLVGRLHELSFSSLRVLSLRTAMATLPRDDDPFRPPLLQQEPEPLEKTFGLCLDHRAFHDGPPYERRALWTEAGGKHSMGWPAPHPPSCGFRAYRRIPFGGYPGAGATIQDAWCQSAVYSLYRVDPWRTLDQSPLYVRHHFPSLLAGRGYLQQNPQGTGSHHPFHRCIYC